MYGTHEEPDSATKVEVKSPTQASSRGGIGGMSGTQLAIIGVVILAAVVALGVIAANNNESAPSPSETGQQLQEQVQTTQQQYQDLLDARPRVARLIAIEAPPAVISEAFDDLDVAQAAVEQSAAGMAGYNRFLIEELESENAALQAATTDGMASPAAVEQIQQNIANLEAEQTRLADG